jgi:hypothetical protein
MIPARVIPAQLARIRIMGVLRTRMIFENVDGKRGNNNPVSAA